jgi:hypothetical protein
MKTGEKVERHIDWEAGRELRERIDAWRPTVLEVLRNVDEDSLSDLTKRAAQIYHPLLALAKVAGGDWYAEALEAAKFFVDKQKPEDKLDKKILTELYRVYLLGKHPKGIWGETFATVLREREFSTEINNYKIAYYLGENGYGIPIRGFKIGGVNKNGYVWDDCKTAFADYLSEETRELVNAEYNAMTVERSRGDGDKTLDS